MDQVRSLSLESLNYQSFKAQYLVKLTQFLVSVSLCSFLFSPSSLFALLHYLNFYFSTFPLQLFTHTIDKNCMFLLCNGLLVFVGITRSFSGSSGGDDPREEEDGSSSSSSSKYVDDGSGSEFSDIEDTEPLLVIEADQERSRQPDEQNIPADEAVEIKFSDEGNEDIEKVTVEDEVDQEEEELRTSHLILEDEETGMLDAGVEEGAERDDFLIQEDLEREEIEYEEEDEEEEEENGRLSTEELNKKFDDFIRRMREDLRIEARQQLIMV